MILSNKNSISHPPIVVAALQMLNDNERQTVGKDSLVKHAITAQDPFTNNLLTIFGISLKLEDLPSQKNFPRRENTSIIHGN